MSPNAAPEGTPRPSALELELGTVDLDARVLEAPSGPRSLSPTEASLLSWLAARPGQPADAPTLLAEVWGYAPAVRSRTVYATINRLRAKIELDPARPRHIVTVVEAGYAFVPLPNHPEAIDGEEQSTTPSTNLGPDPNRFIGRDRVLAEVHARFGGGCRLVTLVGVGGVGKTRLAQVYGRSQLGRMPGGVWFCDLSEARSGADIERIVAAASGGARAESPQKALAGRGAILVVLDNFEQVVDAAPATVRRWLEEAPDARFLVTSRRPLAVAGEEVVELAPLAEADAVALLIERAHAQGADWSGQPRQVLAAIVDRLDRLPLALELTSARARVMDAQELMERLGDRFLLASGTLRDRPARQRSLHAAIEWSWELLNGWERAALAQLSVFRGGFSLGSAEAVLDLPLLHDAPWGPDVVASLRDHSLLQSEQLEGRTRLIPYESVREFAALCLEQDPALGGGSAPGARHAEHFAELGALDRLGELAGPRGAPRRRALSANLENLRAAFEFSVDHGEVEFASKAALALLEVLLAEGPFEAAALLAESALALDGIEPSRRSRLLRCRGRALQLAGRSDEASAVLSAALEFAQEQGHRDEEALILLNRGVLARVAGELDAAELDMTAALVLFGAVGDRSREALARLSLGNIGLERGRVDSARVHYAAALALARTTGDQRAEGFAQASLAALEHSWGSPGRARTHYEAALVLHRGAADRHSEAIVQGNFGVLMMELEEDAEAHRRLSEAIVGLESSQARAALGAFLGAHGELFARTGRMDEAWAAVERGEALLRSVGDRGELGQLLCRLGWVAQLAGDGSRAARALAEARQIAEGQSLGDESLLGKAIRRLQTSVGTTKTSRS